MFSVDEPILEADLGVAFYKDDVRGIAERMDEVFDEMYRDGTLKAIIGKYLDDPEKYSSKWFAYCEIKSIFSIEDY